MASAETSSELKHHHKVADIFARVMLKQCWSRSKPSTRHEMLLFKWLGCMGLRRSQPVVPLLPEEKYLQRNELDALIEAKSPLDIERPSEKVLRYKISRNNFI